jgi:choline-glycine betaine transporter
MITASGKTSPPIPQRIFWVTTEGAVVSALLIARGLTALQTAAITTGFPFASILIFMVFSLQRGLAVEQSKLSGVN